MSPFHKSNEGEKKINLHPPLTPSTIKEIKKKNQPTSPPLSTMKR